MPFINEVLAQNQKQNELAAELREVVKTRSRFAFEPAQVHDFLLSRIVGQDHVIAALCQQLNVIKAGLAEPRRPLLVMLMLGDTGVGKTETVRLLAEHIHGDAAAFCRIDMNTLSQSHYSAAITGAPPGYVGSKENTTLINEEHILGSASRPGIVLFDEVEKASAEVARSLMNVFDNGRLRLASGTRELSFTNCLVFMTSNLGAESWQQRRKPIWSRLSILDGMPILRGKSTVQRRAHFEAALQQHFDPEFLNRIDRIELFKAINKPDVAPIVELEVAQVSKILAKKNITIETDAEVIRHLVEKGFNPRYGARSLRRCVRDELLVPLADAMLYSVPSGAGLTGESKEVLGNKPVELPRVFRLRCRDGRIICQETG